MLPECISSRTSPWPITAFANAASVCEAGCGEPITVAALPVPSASAIACRLQGSPRDSNAQPMRSKRHSLTLPDTSAVRSLSDSDTTERAMRTARGSPACAAGLSFTGYTLAIAFSSLFAAHFDTGPRLDHPAYRSEIRIGAVHRVRHRQHLPHCGAHHHRHAQRLGLVDAKPHVLVRQPGGKAEIERTRQNGTRKLVHGGAVTAGARVEDLEHQLR